MDIFAQAELEEKNKKMVKEFTYRGQTLEDLKKLDTREFAKYLTSKERRSVLKQFNEIENFIKKCQKRKQKGKLIRTHSRAIVIVPRMVGYTIYIHDGHQFQKVIILTEMIGHRLGEFVVTRKKVSHGAAGVGATRSSASASVK